MVAMATKELEEIVMEYDGYEDKKIIISSFDIVI